MKVSPFLLVPLSFLLFAFQIGPATAQSEQSTGGRKIVNKVVPIYPAVARNLNLSGSVKLEALVLPNGNVKSIEVKGGNPLLVQSAQHAIQEWKWEKAEHESTEQVEFRFNP
jgi:TonB family protein